MKCQKNWLQKILVKHIFHKRVLRSHSVSSVRKIIQHLKVLKVLSCIFYLLHKGMFVKQLAGDTGLFEICKKFHKGTQSLRKTNTEFTTLVEKTWWKVGAQKLVVNQSPSSRHKIKHKLLKIAFLWTFPREGTNAHFRRREVVEIHLKRNTRNTHNSSCFPKFMEFKNYFSNWYCPFGSGSHNTL